MYIRVVQRYIAKTFDYKWCLKLPLKIARITFLDLAKRLVKILHLNYDTMTHSPRIYIYITVLKPSEIKIVISDNTTLTYVYYITYNTIWGYPILNDNFVRENRHKRICKMSRDSRNFQDTTFK